MRGKVGRRRPVQLGLLFRPPKDGQTAGVSHRTRPALKSRHPVHVTMKLVAELPNIRHRALAMLVFDALRETRDRVGTRIVQISLQANDLHLILETEGKNALSRAMQWLSARIARR